MRRKLLLALSLLAPAFAAPDGWSVKLNYRSVQTDGNKLQLVIDTPLLDHWAVTITSRPQRSAAARIAAASVQVDGTTISRVDNLGDYRLELKPGSVRILRGAREAATAVCLEVPRDTEVTVRRDDEVLVMTTESVVIRDGKVVARPRAKSISPACISIPVLQDAIQRDGTPLP